MSFTEAQIEAARAVIYELAGMRFADKTIRAALEAAERAAWRPVAEALKDGTHILAVDGYGAMYRAWWNGESFSAHCGQPVVDTPEPTHFRPLPAPPEGTPA